MAESDAQINQTGQEEKSEMEMEKLQYLEIVHLAAIRAVLCVTKLYLYAKENSGPLRNGVESVEGTVKTVVGPVYDRYHTFPFELLQLANRKVGASVQELERHVPEGVKKAPEMARSVVGEVQRAGVVATAAGLAKAACCRAEPAAERMAASAWRSLNLLPVFPQVASAVVPAAAACRNVTTARYRAPRRRATLSPPTCLSFPPSVSPSYLTWQSPSDFDGCDCLVF